jgi:DNA-binding XRE family transcriptional regulator
MAYAFSSQDLQQPTGAQVKEVREYLGDTQTQAGACVRVALRTWQAWEAGQNPMPLNLWELYLIKKGVLDCDDKHPK